MSALSQTIDGIQEVLAICPCCGEIIRLAEGKFIFARTRPRSCEYLNLIATEKTLQGQEDRLTDAEESFREVLANRRKDLREQGRSLAKKKLRKIDPTFSGTKVDPQDVKLIFDPVEYVVFHGLNSEGVDLIEFISRSPVNKMQEIVTSSIVSTISRGNVEFETLSMRDDGSFEVSGTY